MLLNGTVVKPEDTFLQEEVKLSCRDAVIAAEHPFGLIPKILNAVDMIMALGEQRGMVDPVMTKFCHVNRVTGFPAIAINDGIGLYFRGDNGQQGLAGSVGNDFGIDFAAALEQAKDRNFPRRATPLFAFSLAPK